MKTAVYLTDPAEMRKARLNQPRVSPEQARRQRELLQRASEKFSEGARKDLLAWAREQGRLIQPARYVQFAQRGGGASALAG